MIVTPDPEAAARRDLLTDRADSEVRRGRRRARWPIAAALTVASFLLVSGVIGLVVGERQQTWRISVLGQKLAHLRQHGTEYDTLFLGSSRVHYGLDPELFDAEMTRHGCRARSFNMGVQALTINEEHRLVIELSRIGRWERVFVERNPVPLRSLDTLGTDRATLAFGSLRAVRLAIQDIWTSPEISWSGCGGSARRFWRVATSSSGSARWRDSFPAQEPTRSRPMIGSSISADAASCRSRSRPIR